MHRTCLAAFAATTVAAPALAASKAGGPFGWLMDPTTNVAFGALIVFFIVVWRVGGFKAITTALDDRAAKIAAQLDEAKDMREAAAKALAEAERRQQAADEDAKAIITQAKADAKEMMAEARADLDQRLKRREALAEARIQRAESEAADDVRRAAADAATQAARDLLMSDDSVDQFDRAVAEVDKSVG